MKLLLDQNLSYRLLSRWLDYNEKKEYTAQEVADSLRGQGWE